MVVNMEELADPKPTKETKMCLKVLKKFGGCALRRRR